ncbi:hypothetical protein CPC08DRAFT_706404, partial [Agrocybe pediades]
MTSTPPMSTSSTSSIQGPVSMMSRGIKSATQQSGGVPPVYGSRPNIADPNVVVAELGSTTSARFDPQSYHSADRPRDHSVASRDDLDDEYRGRSFVGTGRVQGENQALLGRQRHIDLNTEEHSHPRTSAGQPLARPQALLEKQRTSSPDNHRRSTSSSARPWLSRVPEEMEFPSSTAAAGVGSTQMPQIGTSADNNNHGEHRYYGSVGVGSRNIREEGGSAVRYVEGLLTEDDTSSLSSDEEEWIVDEALAKEGLYRGNYKRLVTFYTFVPLTTLLAFILLGLLPTIAYHNIPKSTFPYPPYLPFPLPEIIAATALWSLSYLLRDFLYATSLSSTTYVPFPSQRYPSFIPVLTSIVSAILQSASTLFFRQLAIPILLIPEYSTEHIAHGLSPVSGLSDLHKRRFPNWQDDAFRRVWWVALGWAAAEAIVGIKQGYESIALYKDVLVDVKDNIENENEAAGKARQDPTTSGSGVHAKPRDPGASTPPVSSSLTPVDASTTPTQRDSGTHSQLVAHNGNRPGPRDRMDSLSSYESSVSYQFHEAAANGSGERQPLLKLATLDRTSGLQSTDDTDRLQAENEVERDLDQLMALKSREELEEVYGMPVIRIPVFISCLHRINSILSSLGITLLLTGAYMRSTLVYHPLPTNLRDLGMSAFTMTLTAPFTPSNRLLNLMVPPLLVLQTILAMMHTPWILPRIGIHTFVYVGLLTSLGLFFGGLGVWEAL